MRLTECIIFLSREPPIGVVVHYVAEERSQLKFRHRTHIHKLRKTLNLTLLLGFLFAV